MTDLALEIQEAYAAHLAQDGKRSPVRSNTAGLLSHPCARRLYYYRTRWKDAPEFSASAIQAMRAGKVYEQDTIRLLQDLGFQLDRTEEHLEWREYQISGRIDGMIRRRGEHPDAGIPLEIKSMSRWIYESISSWQDILHHKLIWIRGYPTQLQIYMLMSNKTQTLFALRCRDTGGMKLVPMPLDLEIAQAAVDRADAVCYSLLNGDPPERITYDSEVCDRCEWFGLCEHPDAASIPPTILDKQWLEEALEERASYEEAAKRYASLDKAIEEHCKKAVESRALCGAWEIKVDRTKGYWRKGYYAPEVWIPNLRISTRKIGG